MGDRPKPTHVYVGRISCGCVMTLITDTSHEGKREAAWVGKSVGEAIRAGQTVTRVSWQEYSEKICHEPGFMECLPEHKVAKKLAANKGQMTLLQVNQ